MQDIVVTTLSPHELRALITDCIEACLKKHFDRLPKPEQSKMDLGDAYISKKQAAVLLSCCASTIDNYARAKTLTRYYVGKSVRFDRKQVLSLAKKH